MKRLSFIVMACLLVLGLTQCKKNESTNNNNTDDNRVSITLQLTNGGQKVHPEEENGLANVVYDNGDVVYVGSDGKYVGYLTYNGTLFTGSINAEATEGQPLQFIFMGGQTIEGLTENSSTECIFNIGDQSNGLAVISGAASNEDFSLTNLSYTAYLRNKCALVRFDLGEVSTDATITLTGMKTEATVGFDGTVTNGETTGDIVTYGTGSTRYAVVLSDQEAVTEGTVSAEGYEGTFSIPTAAYTNAFLTDATMTLTEAAPAATGHALSASVVGEIVCSDGLAYAAADKDNLPQGVTAVAMVAYVGTESDCTTGLAIALEDVSSSTYTWAAAAEAVTTWATGKTPPTTGSWRLPSIKDWQYMFIGCGSGESYSDPEVGMERSYVGLREKLSAAGGTALNTGPYWSSTESEDIPDMFAWLLNFQGGDAFFFEENKDDEEHGCFVRACLAF